MKPTGYLQQVIEVMGALPAYEGKLALEDLNLGYMEIAHDDLKLSETDIKLLAFQMSDLMAVYGDKTDAVSLLKVETPDLELWAKYKEGGYTKITHAINYDDKAFTDKAFIVGMPAGNFSVEYLVYADNEQDALDCLADYEVNRRACLPDIAIFMVDEAAASPQEMTEIQEREDAGEYMRLGNEGNLFDISDVVIKQGSALSVIKGMDIEEHLKLNRKPQQQPGMSL
jgi:hypothetical protein